MVHIEPVGSGGEPVPLLWAWRQAKLEQLAHERLAGHAGSPPGSPPGSLPGSSTGTAKRCVDRPETGSPHPAPPDGPKPGEQSLLSMLRRLTAQSLTLAGPRDELVRRVIERLAATPPELRTLLHGPALERPDDLAAALLWLVDNLDRPSAVAPACAQLGPALNGLLGQSRWQLEAFGLAMMEALRVSLGPAWRQEYADAWRSAWKFTGEWIYQGMEMAAREPAYWGALVLEHQRRTASVAVLRVRTLLPYPFGAGMYAPVESPALAGQWTAVWLGVLPDSTLELHVRAGRDAPVAEALVRDTAAGDRLRLRDPDGQLSLDTRSELGLLLVAEDVTVAAVKGLLAQLARRPGARVAHVFWGVPTRDDLYDLESLRLFASSAHATVHPVVAHGRAHPYAGGSLAGAVDEHGRWSAHDVYLTGSSHTLASVREVLDRHQIPPERVHAQSVC